MKFILFLSLIMTPVFAKKVTCEWKPGLKEEQLDNLKRDLKALKKKCRQIKDKEEKKKCKNEELKPFKKIVNACKKDYRKNKKKYKSEDFDLRMERGRAAEKNSPYRCVVKDHNVKVEQPSESGKSFRKVDRKESLCVPKAWDVNKSADSQSGYKSAFNKCMQVNIVAYRKLIEDIKEQAAREGKVIKTTTERRGGLDGKIFSDRDINYHNSYVERHCDDKNINI